MSSKKERFPSQRGIRLGRDERTEAQGREDDQESRELTEEAPGYGYNNRLIVAAPVIVTAMIFIVIFCLVAICYRTASEEDNEGSSRGFFQFSSIRQAHRM